ncbi:MAG: hypothetical protein ACRD09_05725 [Vicinamibacterales bacterium]
MRTIRWTVLPFLSACLALAAIVPLLSQARKPASAAKASPVGANGKLYISTEEGDVVVVKMGDTFEVVATNTLADQSFIATPAIAGGDIFLRSRTHLFRIVHGPSPRRSGFGRAGGPTASR